MLSFTVGTSELCDRDLTGGTLYPGPGVGHQGDSGHVPQHAWPGGLWGAPGPAETLCFSQLSVVSRLLYLTQVRRQP